MDLRTLRGRPGDRGGGKLSEILTDRTTRFELRDGEAFEVRMIEHEIPDVWQVKLEGHGRIKGSVRTFIELRYLVVRE